MRQNYVESTYFNAGFFVSFHQTLLSSNYELNCQINYIFKSCNDVKHLNFDDSLQSLHNIQRV